MNQSIFEAKIQKSTRPVVVEFWAPWCGPCKVMTPYLKSAEQEFSGQVDLWRINADENPELLRSLGVMGIPTMIGYNNGQQVARKTGAMTLENVSGFFTAVKNNQPFSKSLTWVDRFIRIIPALFFFWMGATNGISYWMLGIGAAFLFSAFYDRCPIYKVVSLQIKAWMKKRQVAEK